MLRKIGLLPRSNTIHTRVNESDEVEAFHNHVMASCDILDNVFISTVKGSTPASQRCPPQYIYNRFSLRHTVYRTVCTGDILHAHTAASYHTHTVSYMKSLNGHGDWL